jgi:hypothetical protein
MAIEAYKNKFVAFLDILGFKQLISTIEEKSQTSFTDFNKVWSILNFLDRESIQSDGHHDLNVYEEKENSLSMSELGSPIITYVSDCVVISTDGTFDGFKSICNKITKFSTDIAADGIFVRGAITYGKVVHTGRILFGTGYQKAYQLESTKAINPRVIIDSAVVEFLKKYDGQFPLNNVGMREDDDTVKYLRLFPQQYYPFYTISWLDYLLRVKSHILYLLNMFDTRVSGFGNELRDLDRYCCWKEKYTYDLDFSGGDDHILKKYIWVCQEFNETLETHSRFLSDNGNMRISKIFFDGKIWRPEQALGHMR